MNDFSDYKGIWVFCEQRGGELMPTDFELVSEARRLANEMGCKVTGVLFGNGGGPRQRPSRPAAAVRRGRESLPGSRVI